MFDKRYIAIFFAVAAGTLCHAQNLDPTVEVSRAYEGKLLEVHKPVMPMSQPDSVSQFNLKFDYSVFDNPFKGSYEFNPYMLNMRPEPAAFDGKTFYFRAGAGYRLNPSADLVWSPLPKQGNAAGHKFRMSIYATHRSYFGDYKNIALSDGRLGAVGGSYNGFQTYTDAGTEGRLDWKGGFFEYDFGYRGIASKDTLLKKHFDAFRGSLRVASAARNDAHFIYDIKLGALLGKDAISPTGRFDISSANEGNFTLDITLGKAFRNSKSFVVEASSQFVTYPAWYGSFAGQVALTPRFTVRKGRWSANLGVKASVLYYDDKRPVEENYLHSTRGQFVYPDVELGWDVVKNALNIYLKATGGNALNTYSSLLERNGRLSPLYAAYALTDNTVERVNASFGLRGGIASRFSYNLYGGYALYASALMDSVYEKDGLLLPSVVYAGCSSAYAALDFAWESADLLMKGNLTYRHTMLNAFADNIFLPSPFTAKADIVYNWNKRIYAGVHCDAAIARSIVSGPLAGNCTIPGYADLGVSFEWRFSRFLSFWLYGGNLLNMTIQRTPLCPEGGISCTAGICIVL